MALAWGCPQWRGDTELWPDTCPAAQPPGLQGHPRSKDSGENVGSEFVSFSLCIITQIGEYVSTQTLVNSESLLGVESSIL